MIRVAAIVAAAFVASTAYSADLTLLQQQLPAIHPHVDVTAFDAAATQLGQELPTLTEDQADVGFMKLVAALGDRNGHTGIFPLDPGNQRTFHEYPFIVYEFADGVFVTQQLGGHDLIGARLTAVGGIPIADVLAQVAPVVPRDNETTGVKNLRWMYLLSEEVLQGLDIAPQFSFMLPGGAHIVSTPTPVTAAAFDSAFNGLGKRMWPAGTAYAADRGRATRVVRLGHAVYVAYNTTTVDTTGLATHIARLASQPGVRRIVVDLRNNRGGDNQTYPPLIEELKRLARHHKRIVVLAGRATFSAAANFMGDLEAATRFLLVGEDSGGAPNLYGDVQPLDLPATGLRVEVATTWWVKSKLGPKDPRLTFHPDVVVRPTAKAWFAGRDPALAAALWAPFSRAHRVH